MNFTYLLKESFSGLRRATLSSVVAVIIIGIALSLFSIFLMLTFNLNTLVENIRSRVELEAFLDKSLDTPSSRKIESTILALEGIESATFVSKGEAAQILKKVMGAEDIFDLVETNPLPASFKIRLKPEYRNGEGALIVAKALENIEGVDEVNYQKELLRALDDKVGTYNRISLSIGIIAAIAAVLLVSNTIKLSIYAKRDLIKTMKLVGAKNSFIAGPFVLEGIIQGLLGSGFAILFSYGAMRIVRHYVSQDFAMGWEVSAILLAFGIMLGFLGSSVSIRFFLKEKISDM